MAEKTDGGPAFPRADSISPDGTFWEAGHNGMSVRDWFAGLAIHSLLSAGVGNNDERTVANAAYRVADALIEERKK